MQCKQTLYVKDWSENTCRDRDTRLKKPWPHTPLWTVTAQNSAVTPRHKGPLQSQWGGDQGVGSLRCGSSIQVRGTVLRAPSTILVSGRTGRLSEVQSLSVRLTGTAAGRGLLQLCVTREPGRLLRPKACMLQGRQFGHLRQGRKLSLVPVKSQSQRVLNKTSCLTHSLKDWRTRTHIKPHLQEPRHGGMPRLEQCYQRAGAHAG